MTFKERRYVCEREGHTHDPLVKLAWDTDPLPMCPCGSLMIEHFDRANTSTSVIGDEIDIEIRHGICHDDGSPRRYRSKAEIRRVALEKGWRNPNAVNGPY